jgi:hypothetical protein
VFFLFPEEKEPKRSAIQGWYGRSE